MSKTLEKGKRVHFIYFLGSTSLLLMCCQQLDKLVASLILRKCWHSYIKRLLKRSQFFKADEIHHCELVEMPWHETYLAYGVFTCSTRKKCSKVKSVEIVMERHWHLRNCHYYEMLCYGFVQFTNWCNQLAIKLASTNHLCFQDIQFIHLFIQRKMCHLKNQLKGLKGSWFWLCLLTLVLNPIILYH